MSKKRNIEENVVFCIAPSDDGKPPVLMIGMPELAWEYMKDGLTHTFDLTGIGVPVRMMLFRGKDHGAVMTEIESAAKAAGIPLLDERRRDFSI